MSPKRSPNPLLENTHSESPFLPPSRMDWMTMLKLLGFLLMVIDHVGAIFFPKVVLFRAVGRLAFPIFAWFFARGYQHTSNRLKYFLRLAAFGIVAQIPYSIFFRNLNILFTFAFHIALFQLMSRFNPVGKMAILISGAIAAHYINLDYSWYGTAMIAMFLVYDEQCRGKRAIAWLAGWGFLHAVSALQWPLQPIAGLALLLIPRNPQPRATSKPSLLKKYAFYIFYPLHLAVLAYLHQFLN